MTAMSDKSSNDEYAASQGSVYLITSDGRTLNLPIASNSPADPLNWSGFQKFSTIAAMSLFSTLGLVLVQGTSMFLHNLEIEYSSEVDRLARLDFLSSIPTLCWIIGSMIWVPLSVAIGKRPVFIICTVLMTLGILWSALSRSSYSHLGARCLTGIATASGPSTILLMLIDLTFIHQRPLYLAGFWALTNSFSNIFLSITPHLVAKGGTWRTFYWFWLGPCILSIVAAFFFGPETSFRRPPMAFDGRILTQTQYGSLTLYSNWDEVPGGKPEAEIQFSSRWEEVFHQIKLWHRRQTGGLQGLKVFGHQCILCVLNPLILWALLLNTLIIGSMIITCATSVQVLLAPPYNFDEYQIGLAKFGPAIAALLAFPCAGYLSHSISNYLTRRNRGVREPEFYLPSFSIPFIVCCASLSLYGVAIENNWNWRLIIFFVSLDYFSAIAIFINSVLWVTASFPWWSRPALLMVGAGSYGISFGISTGIVVWMRDVGMAKMYVELSMVVFAVACMGVPVYIWGKELREYIYSRWGTNKFYLINGNY